MESASEATKNCGGKKLEKKVLMRGLRDAPIQRE